MVTRVQHIEIDLTDIMTSEQLHAVLMQRLGFPDFYGHNWNAFWDAITGLVELPAAITFRGWTRFQQRLPEAAQHLCDCLTAAKAQYSYVDCKIDYI